ncbi:cache domain-containing protein [Leucobacter denitrificans]|uniref:Cache domain-containing protein n=1 Tax=Leucobacter denitrificans TaxID=683042 RepID=A0A7G9S3B4_9MICO|nr:cache domain-containing protein [Leucobacter denitrificans]QNN62339.1 hypothetical protein H9L06_08685 [Leucobacter denitrificans]
MSLDVKQVDISATEGIAVVDDFFDGVFAPLRAWLPELAELFGALDSKITGSQLASLVEGGSYAVLDTADRPLYGAGFCGSDLLVSGGNPLAWWQGPERQLLASSTFGPGQAAIDLERLEWYRVPRQTGEHHVAGPFVDYLCSNEITLTSTVPLITDRGFLGVACADVLLATVEELLMPSIRGIEGAALVNSNGRVVVSTDPDHETGDRYFGIADDDHASAQLLIGRSTRYPFALVQPR